jgi:spermidine/putrescine-binding protein
MQGQMMRRGVLWAVGTAATLFVSVTAVAAAPVAKAPKPPTKAQLHAASAKLVADARKVGTLNLYTSADPVTAQKLGDAFGKKYGIKVTFTRLTSGPIAARYTAEAQAGNFPADVVLIGDPYFLATALSKGWVMPMNPTTVPNVATLEKKFKFYGSVGVAISRVDGFVPNTKLVSPADYPKPWEDRSAWRAGQHGALPAPARQVRRLAPAVVPAAGRAGGLEHGDRRAAGRGRRARRGLRRQRGAHEPAARDRA